MMDDSKDSSIFTILILFVVMVCLHLFMNHVLVYPANPEYGIGSPRTAVMDDDEQPCGCWDLNLLCPFQEQLFLISKPSLQTPVHFFPFNSNALKLKRKKKKVAKKKTKVFPYRMWM